MSQEKEEHELVMVHGCASDGEANIIIGLLRANGIEAMRESDMPHLTLPVRADAKILVNREDAAEAKRIINENKAPSTKDAEEGGEEAAP